MDRTGARGFGVMFAEYNPETCFGSAAPPRFLVRSCCQMLFLTITLLGGATNAPGPPPPPPPAPPCTLEMLKARPNC